MGIRHRVASLLAAAGVADAALRVRERTRLPLLTVLAYHHIAEPGPDYPFDPHVADATPTQFGRHLDLLRRHFSVIGVGELCAWLDGEPLPPNPAIITFDDGYRSCHEVALPMLAARGLRAVFFIPTYFIEERRLFWWERICLLVHAAEKRGVDLGSAATLLLTVKHTIDLDLDEFLADLTRRAGLPWGDDIEHDLADELLMTWDQIRALADAGMDIESHTRRHRVLQTLPADELVSELSGARDDLERQVGRAPRAIAYPVGFPIVGDTGLREAVVRAGYRVGFTNQSGVNWVGPPRARLDCFDLGRIAAQPGVEDDVLFGQLAFPLLNHVRSIEPATLAPGTPRRKTTRGRSTASGTTLR